MLFITSAEAEFHQNKSASGLGLTVVSPALLRVSSGSAMLCWAGQGLALGTWGQMVVHVIVVGGPEPYPSRDPGS